MSLWSRIFGKCEPCQVIVQLPASTPQGTVVTTTNECKVEVKKAEPTHDEVRASVMAEAEKASGALVAALRPFGSTVKCAKCDGAEFTRTHRTESLSRTGYVRGSVSWYPDYPVYASATYEYLAAQCKSCGSTTHEKCADAR